jgi:hypothetical protein
VVRDDTYWRHVHENFGNFEELVQAFAMYCMVYSHPVVFFEIEEAYLAAASLDILQE